jgi:hypothetical protein
VLLAALGWEAEVMNLDLLELFERKDSDSRVRVVQFLILAIIAVYAGVQLYGVVAG